jgi:hypothetical protein
MHSNSFEKNLVKLIKSEKNEIGVICIFLQLALWLVLSLGENFLIIHKNGKNL